MEAIIAAENPNVAASTTNAHPTPSAAMRAPPTSGPMSIIANGRTNLPRAFASTSDPSGTIIGTMAFKDG
jgi:hypothetical protein